MYEYLTERPKIFSEEGLKMYIKIRDNIQRLCKQAGACTIERAMDGVHGDSWMMLAVVDHLAERREVRIIEDADAATQRNIIVLNIATA